MGKSKIEWTDKTWNPITGCSPISAGCNYCYAEVMAERCRAMGSKKYKNGFEIAVHNDCFEEPLRWDKPCRIFVCSMGDLFHHVVPEEAIDKVFSTIRNTPHHTYQILTKRAANMAVYLKRNDVPDNVWVGVTVENKQCASRLDILRGINARIKFVSFEPLLESVAGVDLTGIDWAIVGGESGRNSREMKEEWVFEIQEECERTGTTFFFKQWGGINKYAKGSRLKGKEYKNFPCEDNVSVNEFELAIEEHLKHERQSKDIERQYYNEIINNTSR